MPQGRDQRVDSLSVALAHQAYLNPVPLEEVAAAVANQVSRLQERITDSLRRSGAWQGNGDDRGRYRSLRTHHLQAKTAQLVFQCRRAIPDSVQVGGCHLRKGGVEGMDHIRGDGEGDPAMGGVKT